MIQPFIGLQIGLPALRQKLAAGGGDDIAADVDRLMEMTAWGSPTCAGRYPPCGRAASGA